MRGLAVLLAAAAAATLGGFPMPRPGRLTLPRLRPAMAAAALAAGMGAGLAAISLGANAAAAGALALMGAAAPLLTAASRARRAAEQAAGRWPDFLAALRGRLSAGESLPDATAAAAAAAGDRLAGLAHRLEEGRSSGRPFAATLAEVRADWADPLADRVLTTLAAAAGIGGERVGAVLSGLAGSVADELRLRRAHQAALTEQRLTAGVALGAPWALLLLTTATNPQSAAAYSTATGTWVVLAGLAATSAGFWLSRRAARLSHMPRVFT
jgi:tight adherence protein B